MVVSFLPGPVWRAFPRPPPLMESFAGYLPGHELSHESEAYFSVVLLEYYLEFVKERGPADDVGHILLLLGKHIGKCFFADLAIALPLYKPHFHPGSVHFYVSAGGLHFYGLVAQFKAEQFGQVVFDE